MRIYNISGLRREQSAWQHLPTKAVRVPEVFASQVLNYARRLDGGEQPTDDVDAIAPPDIDALVAEYLKENTRFGAMGDGRDFAHLKKFVEWVRREQR